MSAGHRADLTKRARRALAAAAADDDDDDDDDDDNGEEEVVGGAAAAAAAATAAAAAAGVPPPLRAARSVRLHARALPRRADERGRPGGRVRCMTCDEGLGLQP